MQHLQLEKALKYNKLSVNPTLNFIMVNYHVNINLLRYSAGLLLRRCEILNNAS